MLIQCRSLEYRMKNHEREIVSYIPTLVVNTKITEHQYEGDSANYLKKIEIAGTVKRIPQWAFAIVPSLEEVRLSSNIKSLDDNAFFSCKKLSKINLNNVEAVGENCFKFSALEDVNLTSAQDIKEFAFSNCLNLRKIKFSCDLKTIGDFAFCGDSALVNCHIPTGEIGASAFMGCTNLKHLSFGTVTSIGDAAFLDCTSLKSVVIPSTIKEIGSGAFSGCIELKKVIINNRKTRIAEDAFEKETIITFKN